MATFSIAPHIRINHDFFQYAPQIHGNGFMIFSYLLLRRNAKTGRCYPSLSRIARDLGLDRKTVIKFLKLLEGVGLIRKHATYNGGKRSSNQYDIFMLWDHARAVVNKFLKSPPPPPEIATTASSLEEIMEAISADESSPLSSAMAEKQQTCTHPDHARHQPIADYAFCDLCYAELPTLRE